MVTGEFRISRKISKITLTGISVRGERKKKEEELSIIEI